MISQSKATDTFFIIFMAVAIFALSIKGDGSIEFLTVHYPPLINVIKNNAMLIAAGMVVLMAITILGRQRMIKLTLIDALSWLFIYKFILGSRLFFTTTGPELKQFSSFVMMLVFYFYICCRTENYQTAVTNIIKIIMFASVLLCLINIYNVLFNYAGSSWKGRFFGIYTHPNFLAVNHASIVAVSIGYLFEYKKKFFDRFHFDRAICVFNIVSSLLLMVLSGSRTGMIGLFAAMIIFGLLNYKRNLVLSIILFFLSLGGVTFLLVNLNSLAQYSTGFSRILNAGNTRAAVWEGMISDFNSEPLVGVGSRSLGTAGSYLKVLSQGGLLLFIPFVLMLLTLFKQCLYHIKVKNYLFIYPISCLLACAITEGILTEGASFPILILLLMMIAQTFSRLRDKKLHAAYVAPKNIKFI